MGGTVLTADNLLTSLIKANARRKPTFHNRWAKKHDSNSSEGIDINLASTRERDYYGNKTLVGGNILDNSFKNHCITLVENAATPPPHLIMESGYCCQVYLYRGNRKT